MNSWIIIIAAVLFILGVFFALIRVIKGPSVYDRIAASDMIMAAMMCILGMEMVINHHSYTLPILLGIAVFAMLSSVSVARFIRRDKKQDENLNSGSIITVRRDDEVL